MTVGYAVCFAVALALLIAYIILVKNKVFWLLMLYVFVSVVNLGYLLLSLSQTLAFAIFANDLSYFGSVFLSACMFLTVVELCGFEVKKNQVIICLSLAVLMFAIVATSGFLPWYYKSLKLEFLTGGTKLVKEYGPLHPSYFLYLMGYIIAMIAAILHSCRKNKLGSRKFAGMIAGIVCMNVAVWGVEKFDFLEYEFLSVTYILSELMLLFVYWMLQDYVHKDHLPSSSERATLVVVDTPAKAEKLTTLISSLSKDRALTPKEVAILGELMEGKSRRDIAAIHHISENTVKTHIAHIYDKFGVSGKDALLALMHKKQK